MTRVPTWGAHSPAAPSHAPLPTSRCQTVEPTVLEPGWAIENGVIDGEGGSSATVAGPGAAGGRRVPRGLGARCAVCGVCSRPPSPPGGPTTLPSGWNDPSKAHQGPEGGSVTVPSTSSVVSRPRCHPCPQGQVRGSSERSPDGTPLRLGVFGWRPCTLQSRNRGSGAVGRPGWGPVGRAQHVLFTESAGGGVVYVYVSVCLCVKNGILYAFYENNWSELN